MLIAAHDGELEIRRAGGGAVRLAGRFPYGKRAVLFDGGRTGRPKKEVFASRAFSYRVDRPEEQIHLLVGHSYDRPLASRSAGTLKVADSDMALTFEATIAPELSDVSYVRDFLGALAAGLIVGLSPGFRLPPKRAVAKPETIEDEDPKEGDAIIRTVHEALLFEISAVTAPAYAEALIEARSWDLTPPAQPALVHHSARWR